MKIIIILIISFFILFSTINASLLCSRNDFIIWKIINVDNNTIFLDNYINENIYVNSYNQLIDTRIWILNKKRWLLNKNILYFWESRCYSKTTATKNIEDWKIKLKSWDIVFMNINIHTWDNNIAENHVNIIEKVSCKNNRIYIWNNYNEKLDKKIGWCVNLSSFFNQDRTFEDLEWNNLNLIYTKMYIKKYIKENITYFILLFWIIFILFTYKFYKMWFKLKNIFWHKLI
jgi:hypothetical protein